MAYVQGALPQFKRIKNAGRKTQWQINGSEEDEELDPRLHFARYNDSNTHYNALLELRAEEERTGKRFKPLTERRWVMWARRIVRERRKRKR